MVVSPFPKPAQGVMQKGRSSVGFPEVPALMHRVPQLLLDRLHTLLYPPSAHPPEIGFPCLLEDILPNEHLLSALHDQLATAENLADLITKPPAILLDEYQQLFFYRGIPVKLRPITFSYLLILARTPEKYVRREGRRFPRRKLNRSLPPGGK